MSTITLDNASKRFGPTVVLDNLDLVVPNGSLTAVLGASGSGKTTLLRVIAGFEHLDTGTLTVGGVTFDDSKKAVRTQHRDIGYVPQEGALFPHMTVAANIGFGLRGRSPARVGELVELVGLHGLEHRYPHQLSGGQQQRVAVARALAIEPQVVLLDEPFGSLDASLRDSLRRDVIRILSQAQTTTILVTHDQDEALAVADQVAILQHGRIVASASPQDLYRDPKLLSVATAVGESNILPAKVERNGAAVAMCVLGAIPFRAGAGDISGECRLLLRPEQLHLHDSEFPGTPSATIEEIQYHGHDSLAFVRLDSPNDTSLIARVSGTARLQHGRRVWIEVIGAGTVWPAH